jgi:zinc transport system permease protein
MFFFQYDFMLRALIGAMITGVSAPSIGTYLVQRRLALIGDGIGHVALTGVGVGLLLNRSPVITAVIVSALGAIAIELIRERGKASGDIALALLFYGGISGGVALVSLSSDSTNANLMSYLFGSPLTTSQPDLVVISILGAVVLVVTLWARPWLFAISHDEEYARVAGLPVRALNLTLAIITAVTVTVAMRAVGLLLVSALMIVPVAAAQLVTRGFRSTMALAMVLGLIASIVGLAVSWELDTPPGASTVLLAILGFGLIAAAAGMWRRRLRARLTAPDSRSEPPDLVLGAASSARIR